MKRGGIILGGLFGALAVFGAGCGEDDAHVTLCVDSKPSGVCFSRNDVKPYLHSPGHSFALSRNCDSWEVESVDSDATFDANSATPCCYQATLSFSDCSAFGSIERRASKERLALQSRRHDACDLSERRQRRTPAPTTPLDPVRGERHNPMW